MKNGKTKEIRYYIWDNDLHQKWGQIDYIIRNDKVYYYNTGEYDDLRELLQNWALSKPEEEWGEWYNDDEGNYLGDDYKFEDYVKSLSNEDIIHELFACSYEVRQIIDIEFDTNEIYKLKKLINKSMK